MNKTILRQHIRQLGLSKRPVCAHTSLSSFGHLEGGAAALVDAYLEEGCTLLVPAFVYKYQAAPPKDCMYRQNGGNMENDNPMAPDSPRYSPLENEISSGLGIVPREVLSRPERVRGPHPINALAAIGPLAEELIAAQTLLDVYGPYARAAELNGAIALMGVGLNRCTPIHWAEELAGKTLFVRWSLDAHAQPMECSIGSCSNGFEQVASITTPFEQQVQVGQSQWRVMPLAQTMDAVAQALRQDPGLTHCDNPACERCNDMEKGGLIRNPSLV